MVSFYEVYKAKERLARDLLQQKGVFGVGVGYHDPKDPVKGASLIVYMQKASANRKSNNLSRSNLLSSQKITTTINSNKLAVPMRIVDSNYLFRANVVPQTKFSKKIRPVHAGYSVGIPKWSGTAGLIVTNYQGNKLFVASNNHVLNKNNSSGYSETVQPGGADSGKSGGDRIGRMYRYVKLRKYNNYLDAAISIPLNNSLLTPKYAVIGKIKGHYANYRIGWKFIKVGRTTGLVGGVVESINTDVKVNYGKYGGLGVIQFKNQTIIRSNRAISLPGDSGSVWLHSKNYYATAVNYAGTPDGKLSVSYPIHWLMQAFGTRVALPGNKTGRILSAASSSANTKPLSNTELASISKG